MIRVNVVLLFVITFKYNTDDLTKSRRITTKLVKCFLVDEQKKSSKLLTNIKFEFCYREYADRETIQTSLLWKTVEKLLRSPLALFNLCRYKDLKNINLFIRNLFVCLLLVCRCIYKTICLKQFIFSIKFQFSFVNIL